MMGLRAPTLFALAGSVLFSLLVTSVHAAGGFPQPNICTRSCWNARAPQGGIVQMSGLNRAIIHHTAVSTDYNTTSLSSSASRVRAIQNFHMDVNGWVDIGYHFLTDKLGNTFEGRHGSMGSLPRGAHDGVNFNSFGFAMMGYFHSPVNDHPTTAHRNATYDVIAWRIPDPFTGYGSGSYGGSTVGFVAGHRNVGSTACPGNIMYNNYIGGNFFGGEARNAINARITGPSDPPPDPPSDGIIVDNDDPGFSASSNWFTATWASDKFGDDYRGRSTESISDPATWTASLPHSGEYEVWAWWTAGSNRATAAPYIVHHADGSDHIHVNQTQNGGQWNLLGTFDFDEGSNSIQLSCWTGSGDIVIADAVMWAPKEVEIIVDNSDAAFSASGNWWTATWAGDKFGADYHVRETAFLSDPATWNVNIPSAGSWSVYAWWTAASNRATSAPYIVHHADGSDHIHMNQTQNGGQWNLLGSFDFNAGATSIQLSCWTGSGDIVIADAVRLVRD